jgi:ABC-type glycerol-3-phosphate transport system substrate-binding protein
MGLALTGFSILEACTQPRGERADLTVWKSPHSPGDQDFFNGKLSDYQKGRPNVTATYRVIPWDQLTETLTAAFRGSSPPDILYLPNSFFPKYAEAGQLADLESIAGADVKKWRSYFSADNWSFGSHNGKQYGLPILRDGVVLVWNKSAFRDAGLDPETKPATWDDLRTYAQKLTKKDAAGRVTQWGYGIMDNTDNFMLNFVPVPMVNYGGDLITADNKKWIGNSPGHVQGLQLQVDIMMSDKTAPPFGTFVGTALNKAFLDGKVATYLSYDSFLVPLMKDYPNFEMGVSTPPKGPVNNETVGGVGLWFIAAMSKNKTEAWKLTEFLAEPSVLSPYCKLSSLLPARTDIDPFAGDKLMQSFSKAQGQYTRLPALPFDFWQMAMPEAEGALNGQKSAREALDTAAKKINDKIAAGG